MAEASPLSALDPALLERIRRGFPLRLDAMGRFLFEGDEITHPGVIELFRSGIDRNDAGELVLRVGEQWTYLNPTDCPLRVLAVLGDPKDATRLPRLRLDDGRELELDPETLVEEDARGLRCEVPAQQSGRPLPARFSNRASVALAEWIDFDAAGRARFRLGERVFDIPSSNEGV
jgi:hypothetical protein